MRSGPFDDNPNAFQGPQVTEDHQKAPHHAENSQVGGLFSSTYFFLPWFFTASIAAFAASGSRYVPPGFNGRKSASSS